MKPIILSGFEAKKGGHCESSSILNALGYLGYGLSEADIVGGGGAPSFFFSIDGFPFLGGRNDAMRETFLASARIPYHVAIPHQKDAEWPAIAALIERGLPVALRVDMRYLPYLYGGKYGPAYMSFGAHWICLVGIDDQSREALVKDTARGGPLRLKLSDLERARSSTTKTFPPRGEYVYFDHKPEGWSFDADAVAQKALETVFSNYGAARSPSGEEVALPLVGIAGLEAFPAVLASFHTRVNRHALASAYSYMAGNIERHGTGGSAFRKLFRDFLVARSSDCRDPRLREACAGVIPSAEAAMRAWSALATCFDEAAQAIGASRGHELGVAALAAEKKSADKGRDLYAAESALHEAIASAIAATKTDTIKEHLR